MKKRIIITGYPKSGNTWVTRLTAEIMRCPVSGFWCEPLNKEEAIEGEKRNSNYQCFKSHFNYEQLNQSLKVYGNGNEKIIYVYRDPRDILLSASNFYSLTNNPTYMKWARLPMGLRFYYRFIHTKEFKLNLLSEAMVHGSKIGPWLETSWADHVYNFHSMPKDILFVSYESLINNPINFAHNLCTITEINRSDDELLTAIDKQSFSKKKEKFLNENNYSKAHFLRSGSTGKWKKELPEKYQNFLIEHFSDLMSKLEYK